MAVWVVVGVIGLGAVAAAFASRRHAAEVEPTVRQFAEFRDALSQQVGDIRTDTRGQRYHVERPEPRLGETDATSSSS